MVGARWAGMSISVGITTDLLRFSHTRIYTEGYRGKKKKKHLARQFGMREFGEERSMADGLFHQ